MQSDATRLTASIKSACVCSTSVNPTSLNQPRVAAQWGTSSGHISELETKRKMLAGPVSDRILILFGPGILRLIWRE